jgi:uncharacterized membrane protein YfcA
MFLMVFGFIGSMRGWAKELLVVFSIILALALIAVLENLIPYVGSAIKSNPMLQYWVRTIIVIALTFFGYQSPKISRLEKATVRRDRIQDVLLGFVMGLISGYFVVGTLWYFSAAAGYPGLMKSIQPAQGEIAQSIERLLKTMPPLWLGKTPNIYIAVVFAFIFVIVVFL